MSTFINNELPANIFIKVNLLMGRIYQMFVNLLNEIPTTKDIDDILEDGSEIAYNVFYGFVVNQNVGIIFEFLPNSNINVDNILNPYDLEERDLYTFLQQFIEAYPTEYIMLDYLIPYLRKYKISISINDFKQLIESMDNLPNKYKIKWLDNFKQIIKK